MRYSVIVPLYNKAPYVQKTLESAIEQTFEDYEIVVVDDGSKDESAEIAENLLKSSGRRYQLIRQDNAGVSTARNNAIASAKGDFICLLDADDWWEPKFLECIDKLTSDYPGAGFYCTNYYYVHNGKSKALLDIPTGYFNFCKEYARTLHMIATSSICFKKTTFDEVGGFKPCLKLGEDFDLLIRLSLKYGSAIYNQPLAYFNNDLPDAHRTIHRLHKPESHMLWNLDYLSDEENSNPDYKQLIDNLRVYSLFPYFLSKEYHNDAVKELNKVDWKKQNPEKYKQYQRPIFYLKLRQSFLLCGSKIKQFIIKHI